MSPNDEGPAGTPGPGPDRGPSPEPPAAEPPPEDIPWGQRFYDRPFLLLFLGLLVMLICFTGWGLWEITQMPTAPLP